MPASISTIVVVAKKHCGHASATAACSVHTAPSGARRVNDSSRHARPYASRRGAGAARGPRSRRHGRRLPAAFQDFPGVGRVLAFPGDRHVGFAFASAVYFYGGWPFLTGLITEWRKRLPGMMTLVGLSITVAYAYSAAVVLGLHGNVFFWETATLIDIMLLGHWIEMRSVLGASRALEELVRLLPAEAH